MQRIINEIISAKKALASFLNAMPLSVKEDETMRAYVEQLQQRQNLFNNISVEQINSVSSNLREISKRCHLSMVKSWSNKDQLSDDNYVQVESYQLPHTFYRKINKTDVAELNEKQLNEWWRIAVLEILVLMLGLEVKVSLDRLESVQKHRVFNVLAGSIKTLNQQIQMNTRPAYVYISDAVKHPKFFLLKPHKKLEENEASLFEKISALSEMNTDLNVIIKALEDPTTSNLEAFTERANLHKKENYDFGCCESMMMAIAPIFALAALSFLVAGILVACPLVGIPLAVSLVASVGAGAGMAAIYGVSALVFGVSSGLMFYKGCQNKYELSDAGKAMMDTVETIKSNKNTIYSAS